MTDMQIPAAGNVLLVDDDILVLKSLARVLRKSCGKIHMASNCQDALMIMRSHPIDVVVSDIFVLPMLGLELLRHIARRYPDVTSILLSGRGGPEGSLRAIQDGVFQTLVPKPWNDEDVIAAVELAYETTLQKRQRRLSN